MVVVPPLAAAALVTVASLLSARQYMASASFVPQEPPAAQAGLSDLARQFGLAAPRANASSPQFYADLLASREVLRGLVLTPYRLGSGRDSASDLLAQFHIANPDRNAAVLAAIRRLRRMLAIRTDRNTGVVHFEIRSRNPELSSQVASRLLELVNDFNLRGRQIQARAEREFVDYRLALADSALASAEEALSAFYRRNRQFQGAPELVAAEARLKRQVDLRQQLYITLAQNREAARIEEVRNTPLITVLERPESFVEPEARGTVSRALVVLIAVGFLTIGLAFLLEYVSVTGTDQSPDYREFVALRRGLLAKLRMGTTPGDPA